MMRNMVWYLLATSSAFFSCSKGDPIKMVPAMVQSDGIHTVKRLLTNQAQSHTRIEVSGFEETTSKKSFTEVNPPEDCAKHLSTVESAVKTLGFDGNLLLNDSEGFAFSFNGNNGDFSTKLSGLKPGATLAGTCIYLDGSQNQLLIEVDIFLPTLKIIARGKQTDITVSVAKGARLSSMEMDFQDPASSLYVIGSGSYDCSKSLKLRGATIDVVCKGL